MSSVSPGNLSISRLSPPLLIWWGSHEILCNWIVCKGTFQKISTASPQKPYSGGSKSECCSEVRYLAKEGRKLCRNTIPFHLECGLCLVICSQRIWYDRRGVGSNFAMEKSGKHTSARCPSKNQQWYVILIALALDMMRWEWNFTSKAFLPNHSPSLTPRKISDRNWGMFYKILASTPQNLQDDQEKKSLRNCYRPEEFKEIWQLNISIILQFKCSHFFSETDFFSVLVKVKAYRVSWPWVWIPALLTY